MFSSWFKPRCPVSTHDKVWIETRLGWLAEEFGLDTMRRAELILPTADYYPQHWHGTEAQAQDLFRQVADWMGVRPEACALEFIEDLLVPGAMGHYDATDETVAQAGRPVIRIANSVLQLPAQLAATMAHELAHERLLGEKRLTNEVADHELVTDLLPAFLGLGIVQANATIHEQNFREGRQSWSTTIRAGYLTSMQLGYALAVCSWHRDDDMAPYLRELRLDARSTYRAGLRFLSTTGETLFPLAQAKRPPAPFTEQQWLEGFSSPRADVRLATVWQWQEAPLTTAAIRAAFCERLNDKDRDIPASAARAFAEFQEFTAAEAKVMAALLDSANDNTVLSALEVFEQFPQHPSIVVPHLVHLLENDFQPIELAAIHTLTAYGRAAAAAIPTVVKRLVRGVRQSVHEEELATAFCAISEQPAADFQALVHESVEEEICDAVYELIEQTQERMRLVPSATAEKDDEDDRDRP